MIEKLYKPPFLNLLKAYGIIAFQFDIHPMLLTIQVDMLDKSKIGKAVCNGIFTTITLSVITTCLAYLKYGMSITPNVLETLPRSWTLYVVILLVTLQLCLSSVIGNSALFQHLEDIFCISRNFCFKRCLLRTCLVCSAVLIGEFIPKFDLIMGIIGGSLTGPLIFILPPLFYTKMLELETKSKNEMNDLSADNDEQLLLKTSTEYGTIKSVDAKPKTRCLGKILQSECLLSGSVIIFGLLATFSSTYYNIFDVRNFNQFWSPCIQNISLSYTFLDF